MLELEDNRRTSEEVTRDAAERAQAYADLNRAPRHTEDPDGTTTPSRAAARVLQLCRQPAVASTLAVTMSNSAMAVAGPAGPAGSSLVASMVAGLRRGGTASSSQVLEQAMSGVAEARAADGSPGLSGPFAGSAAADAVGGVAATAAAIAGSAAGTGSPDDAVNYVPIDESTGEYSWMEVTPPSPREVSRATAQRRHIVRRPTLGLVQYSNRFATLEVIARDGTETGQYIELFNSSYRTARHPVNTNFIIHRTDEEFVESTTVVQTLGDWYLADAGENPRMFKVSGALFESRNFPWVQEFRLNYEKYLRARQCILRRAQVYLTIDDMMYVGYILAASLARDATVAWPYVPFSLSMVLRDVVDVRAVNVFPDVPNPEDHDLIDPKTGDLFREGVRVATLQPGVNVRSDISVGTLAEISSHLGVGDVYVAPTSSNAQLAEIVHGSYEGDLRVVKDLTLEYRGDIGAAETRIDVNSLVSLARRMNAMSGRTMFNVQRVRNGYFAGRKADFLNLGITNPDALARFGFPTEYQQASDARRRRQQEEYRDAIETGIQHARDAVDNLRAEVRWL